MSDRNEEGLSAAEIAETLGSGAFQIVGGGSGGWEDKDWTRREYETAQQAKAAGEKYAAKVFNRACSAR